SRSAECFAADWPVMMASTTWSCARFLANTPAVSRVQDNPVTPAPGQRPVEGRSPYMPQWLAGIEPDPPAPGPSAISTDPSATATELPAEEPPAERVGCPGSRTGP